MLFYSKISRLALVQKIIFIFSVTLLLLSPGEIYAQEEDPFESAADDSLLFGDEFDLGGDDFSFDFDEGEETDTSAVESGDFFGESEDEVEEETVDSTPAGDDWGLGGDSDFDNLFDDDSTGGTIGEVEYSDHPLDFRKKFRGTLMEDTGLTLSLYSPQYVADKMDTWYSFMDFSLTIELPWHYEFKPINVGFLVDISSFKFENSFPAGGTFSGASLIPMVRAEAFGAEVEAGMGLYYPTFGIMTGLGYSYQFHSLFVSAGYRWNWVYKIDPIGSGWWMEPRITTGVKLW
ncbi:hypothetical protein HQ531_04435 [bacterium]|nr:hypothetical protein [bacterium]